MDIEPSSKKDASVIMEIRAILLNDKPKVRGKETSITFLISKKSIFKDIFGKKPQILGKEK